MPRKITFGEHNPLNLSDAQRHLCMELLQSMEESANALREERSRHHYWQDWTSEDERRLRKSVYKSAYNQISGRQKTASGHFKFCPPVTDEDMSYVHASLGVAL